METLFSSELGTIVSDINAVENEIPLQIKESEIIVKTPKESNWLIRVLITTFVRSRAWIGVLAGVIVYMGISGVCFTPETAIGNFVVGNIPAEAGFLDLRFSYDVDTVSLVFAKYGEEGRAAYARNLVTIDVVFPVIMAGTLLFILGWLFYGWGPKNSKWQYVLLVPVGACTADFVENGLLFSSVSSFPAINEYVVLIASFFTSLKWLCLYASFAAIPLVGIVTLVVLMKRRAKATANDGSIPHSSSY